MEENFIDYMRFVMKNADKNLHPVQEVRNMICQFLEMVKNNKTENKFTILQNYRNLINSNMLNLVFHNKMKTKYPEREEFRSNCTTSPIFLKFCISV